MVSETFAKHRAVGRWVLVLWCVRTLTSTHLSPCPVPPLLCLPMDWVASVGLRACAHVCACMCVCVCVCVCVHTRFSRPRSLSTSTSVPLDLSWTVRASFSKRFRVRRHATRDAPPYKVYRAQHFQTHARLSKRQTVRSQRSLRLGLRLRVRACVRARVHACCCRCCLFFCSRSHSPVCACVCHAVCRVDSRNFNPIPYWSAGCQLGECPQTLSNNAAHAITLVVPPPLPCLSSPFIPFPLSFSFSSLLLLTQHLPMLQCHPTGKRWTRT